MSARSPARFSLVEYGAPRDLSQDLRTVTGLDRSQCADLLRSAGQRVAAQLGLKNNPVEVDSAGVRASKFAGLLRVSPVVELEVAPKFLGLALENDGWREDFFFLATLSKHGRLLSADHLGASGGSSGDLATLIARSLTGMYQGRKQRPVRQYRRVQTTDFYVDDDPDPMDLVAPGPDGFEQQTLSLDRRNVWNSTMHGAARELLAEVTDPSTFAALSRMVSELAPQPAGQPRQKPLPARFKEWRPAYELSLDVLRGLGLSYKYGTYQAPGYVVSTWQMWEDLMTVGARLGFGHAAVAPQKGFAFAEKTKPLSTRPPACLHVYPDIHVIGNGNRPEFLLDAKYKGHVEKGKSRISEADLYEAYAFACAAGCRLVVLAYPGTSEDATPRPGTCALFETISVGGTRIFGVNVEVRGISATGALRLFSSKLTNDLVDLVARN